MYRGEAMGYGAADSRIIQPMRGDADPMNRLTSLSRLLVRTCVIVALLLGLLLWGGVAGSLIHLHMLFGALLVLGLWAISVAALSLGRRIPLAIVGLAWGVLTLWLGVSQAGLLPGSGHWVIQVLHLLVGLIAAGLAEMIAGAVLRRA